MTHSASRIVTIAKTTYSVIQMHSPMKPVIVFVPSRRMTATDLLKHAASNTQIKTDRLVYFRE